MLCFEKFVGIDIKYPTLHLAAILYGIIIAFSLSRFALSLTTRVRSFVVISLSYIVQV